MYEWWHRGTKKNWCKGILKASAHVRAPNLEFPHSIFPSGRGDDDIEGVSISIHILVHPMLSGYKSTIVKHFPVMIHLDAIHVWIKVIRDSNTTFVTSGDQVILDRLSSRHWFVNISARSVFLQPRKSWGRRCRRWLNSRFAIVTVTCEPIDSWTLVPRRPGRTSAFLHRAGMATLFFAKLGWARPLLAGPAVVVVTSGLANGSNSSNRVCWRGHRSSRDEGQDGNEERRVHFRLVSNLFEKEGQGNGQS